MPSLSGFVRRLLRTRPTRTTRTTRSMRSTRPAPPVPSARPARATRSGRPLLPQPRGEYANDGFPRVHPRPDGGTERPGASS